MIVQAGGVRRLLRPEQEREREALDVVEGTGREALAEMRRLLGVLARRGRAPRRSRRSRALGTSTTLLEQMREAGLPVELTVEGEPRALAAGRRPLGVPDRAGGADERAQARGPARRAESTSRYGADALELEVANDGLGAPRRPGRRAARPRRDARARRASYGGHARRPGRGPAAASPCARGCRSRARA